MYFTWFELYMYVYKSKSRYVHQNSWVNELGLMSEETIYFSILIKLLAATWGVAEILGLIKIQGGNCKELYLLLKHKPTAYKIWWIIVP